MSEMPTEFIDVPPADFPFTIQFLDAESERIVWESEVREPGALLVPGKNQVNEGRPVRVRVTYSDGEVVLVG